MNILIAEDDATSCVLLRKLLEKWGHNVASAENGRVALDVYQTRDFRVVISDWSMPEMDGVELCQAIRSCGRKDYCYFILLTARSEKENLISGLDAGADDYLVKPVHPEELRARLKVAERILAMQSDLRQLREILPICAWCKSLRNDEQHWLSVESYIASHDGVELTHSMCPDCFEKQLAGSSDPPAARGHKPPPETSGSLHRLPRN